MKRRKAKKKNILLLLLSILIITILILNLHYYYKESSKGDIYFDDGPFKTEESWPKEESFSLVGTGDALVHSDLYLAAKTSDGYDFDSMLKDAANYISKYDVKYINQETVFASGKLSGYPRFNTPKEWGDALINAGFNLFSLATNHSMDRNESGAIDHINYFKSKENIGYAGMNLDDETPNYYIDTVNGITYGFLSYTEQTNGIPVPSDKPYLVDVYEYEKVKEDVDTLKDYVDVVIVAMHWGTEYTAEPNNNQKRMAKELASMDVDIVLGNHPHWIQPIEKIDDTLVIYSMGNFLSNQIILINDYPYTDSVAVGAMVSMDINKTTEKNGDFEVDVDNINVEFVFSHKYYDKGYKYNALPFSMMDESVYKNYKTSYEKHKKRITMYSDSVNVNPIN